MNNKRKHLNGIRYMLNHASRVLLAILLLVASVQVKTVLAETYAVNFKDTDIHELIRFVADATGLTIIIDPKVKGKVEVISTKPVSEKELYDLFLAVLETHGFTAVQKGSVIRVVPSKDARSMPVPLINSDSQNEDNSEIVTQVIEVENVNAAKLIPILRPLVPQQSHMAAYAESNAIIISDTAANINRILAVIKKIDTASLQENEVIKLKHASADETVRILEQMEKSQPGGEKARAVQKRVSIVADKRTNSIILSGDPLSRARIKALIEHLDSPLESTGNARVIFLRYAKAKELADVLTKVTQNMAKLEAEKNKGSKTAARSGAIIEADEATNAIIVTAEADIMSSLDAIINRLDIPRSQVLVEAIIVEINNRDGRQLGVEWLFANDNNGFGSFSNPPSVLAGIAGSVAEDDPLDYLQSLGGTLASNAGGTFGVGKLSEDGTSFTAVLQALEEDTDANILSTPSLLTLDNHEASITVGEEVPFITGSYTSTGGDTGSTNPSNPFQTIERKNVGVSLTVTPHINDGDAIILDLVQEVSSRTGAVQTDIIINERRIETSVLTSDGAVVVLGGLIKEEVQESEKKVPFLGDIPLLGHLFKSNTTDIVKTNLLVFIRPTIINNAEELATVSKAKYNSIKGFQMKERADGVALFKDEVIPALPDWEQQIQQLDDIRKEVRAEAAAEQTAEDQPEEKQ